MLDDRDVLAAVQRCIEKRGESVHVTLPGAAHVTWRPLLEGTIVRCIETRAEDQLLHRGPIDLSKRPVYDTTIHQHKIPAPKNPSDATAFKLVRQGSVDDRPCDCGNGKVACQRCKGRGDLPCDASTTCAECRGLDCCLRCEGTGHRTRKTAHTQEQETVKRVTCKQCGAREAACAVCQGRGRLTCTTCQGAGTRTCPDCDRAGTVPHERCNGGGRIVTWTQGVITRRPHTEQIKLPSSGVPYVARQQARERGQWKKTHLTGNEALPDDLEREFGSTMQTRLLPQDQEIARQTDLRHLPLARVAVMLHPHRVYYVFPAFTELHVLVLPSQQRTWQIAAALLGALIVLAVVSRIIA